MLNGGPGGPKDLGNKSTHIIRRPWGNTTKEQSQTEMEYTNTHTHITCSISGCRGLYSGLVSTCSGTSPILLKMWRASCSLIGPRWRLNAFLSSEINKQMALETAILSLKGGKRALHEAVKALRVKMETGRTGRRAGLHITVKENQHCFQIKPKVKKGESFWTFVNFHGSEWVTSFNNFKRKIPAMQPMKDNE